MWLNLTLFNQSTLFTVIRELEYALLQLTRQADELLTAVQVTLSGKLPLSLISPHLLNNILRNIFLCLPENYELIAGTKFDSIHEYYELIKITIKLLLEFPLKTESQRFTLFRIIVLPVLIINDTFAVYQLENDYFGLSHNQRNFILMTEVDVQKCDTSSVTICLADRALCDVRSITCESKLYFQTITKDGPCSGSLRLNYETPTLLRHEGVWVYHFSTQRQVTFRCPRVIAWVTHTRTLSSAGLIHNATRCVITSGEIRTLPEPHGVARANIDAPAVCVTDSLPVLSTHELPRVVAALTSEVDTLDQLKDRLAVAHTSLDVDTLLHIQKATFPQDTRPHWHLILATASCMISVLLVLGILIWSRVQCAALRRSQTDKPPEEPPNGPQAHPVPASKIQTTTVYSEPQFENVTFTTYTLTRKD
jgi:hypothetical protein